MKILKTWGHSPDIQIAQIDEFPKDAFEKQVHRLFGERHPFLQWRPHVPALEFEKSKRHREFFKNIWGLNLAALHKDQIVGFAQSMQDTGLTAMMTLSAVEPEFRGKGIYSALARKTLELTKEEGFQAVNSYHSMTNNAILIAKLKLGFQIYALEIHPIHGTLLKMVFNHNELFNKSLRYRAGEYGVFTQEEVAKYYSGAIIPPSVPTPP